MILIDESWAPWRLSLCRGFGITWLCFAFGERVCGCRCGCPQCTVLTVARGEARDIAVPGIAIAYRVPRGRAFF